MHPRRFRFRFLTHTNTHQYTRWTSLSFFWCYVTSSSYVITLLCVRASEKSELLNNYMRLSAFGTECACLYDYYYHQIWSKSFILSVVCVSKRESKNEWIKESAFMRTLSRATNNTLLWFISFDSMALLFGCSRAVQFNGQNTNTNPYNGIKDICIRMCSIGIKRCWTHENRKKDLQQCNNNRSATRTERVNLSVYLL